MGKKKPGFSPSKSEFILLCGLLFIAVVALMLNYLVFPAYNKYTESKNGYDLQFTLLDGLKREYGSLEAYRENENELKEKLYKLHDVIPENYAQEDIIAELNKAASQSGLRLTGISFSGAVTEQKSEFLTGLYARSASSSGGTAENGAAADASGMITYERITLEFTGSFFSYQAFLSSFEISERKVYFRDVSMTADEESILSGSMTMLVFGVGVPAEEYPGYEYDAPEAPGAENPFAPYENYISAEEINAAEATPDFFMILNTYDDNNRKIQMGKYPISAAQIASDLNGNAAAKLNLSGTGGEYRYTYSLDGEQYSGTFSSAAGDIRLSVLSRDRKNAEDLVGVTLDVENNTDKTLVITVKNDDAGNPRFILGATTGSVRAG